MLFLSITECSEWLKERAVTLGSRNYPLVPESKVLEFPIPSHAGEAVALAYMFADMERATCAGGLFVMREWSIGSPGLDAIGHEIVKRMLGMHDGEVDTDRPLGVALDVSEGALVSSLLLQAMIFGWDAFYVSSTGTFVIFISHDEVAYVAARNAPPSEDVRIQFERLSIGSVPTPYYLSLAANQVTAS